MLDQRFYNAGWMICTDWESAANVSCFEGESQNWSPNVIWAAVLQCGVWHCVTHLFLSIPLRSPRGIQPFPSKSDIFVQCWFNVGQASTTLAQHWVSIVWTHPVGDEMMTSSSVDWPVCEQIASPDSSNPCAYCGVYFLIFCWFCWVNQCVAVSFVSIFHSFEADIANAISIYKWRNILIFSCIILLVVSIYHKICYGILRG